MGCKVPVRKAHRVLQARGLGQERLMRCSPANRPLHRGHHHQLAGLEPIIHNSPLDLARSWHKTSTARRSVLSIRLQRVISSTVRWQPVQISSSSSAQILTQGEATGRSVGVILLAQPDHGHTAGHYARSARHWLRASSSGPRSAHALLFPGTPSPANRREFPCLRRSGNWRR